MKISIITATYNSAISIESCLNSVTLQTYGNIEHIIIDGASIDNTLEIIKSTPNRVTQIFSEPDNGIYDALNKGINLSTGEIIGFLHSDDLLASLQIIDKIVHVFQQSNVDGVFGDLEYVTKEDTHKVIRYWKSKPFKKRSLSFGWMPAHPTLFLKREVYQKYGLFDLSLKISSDYDFMIRILSRPELKFEYLPEVISKMRIGGISNKNIKNIIQKSREDIVIMRKNKIGFYILFLKNIQKLSQFFLRQ